MRQYPRHVLQSSLWASFRSRWGTKVIKVGKTHFTIHPMGILPWNIGYMARVFPKEIPWELLVKKARQERCIFVKIEPNSESFRIPPRYDIRRGQRMFAHATFLLDLRKSEEELLSSMHPKTRYNIGLAKRKGVEIKIGDSQEMLETFLALFRETALRQNFFNHPDGYYKTLFSVFQKRKAVAIVTGYYQGKPLVSMFFLFYNKTLFYPYGASTLAHKEVMAPYLVFWEAIRLGKNRGCHYFDLWNCLLPKEENPAHPWYGFHRFKKGFGGDLVRFCGAYDLVLIPQLYPAVLFLNKIRWAILKTGAFLKKAIKV